MLFLRNTSPTGKERHYDSFLAGLLGGYTVFGRTIHNSVSQQIVIYVAARVCLALAKLAVQQKHLAGGGSTGGGHGGSGGWELFGDGDMRRAMVRNGWPVFASLSWAMVMYIFRWHPESVQSSLRSSMSYMYVLEHSCDCTSAANTTTVMYNRTSGIHFEHYSGIIDEWMASVTTHVLQTSKFFFTCTICELRRICFLRVKTRYRQVKRIKDILHTNK